MVNEKNERLDDGEGKGEANIFPSYPNIYYFGALLQSCNDF